MVPAGAAGPAPDAFLIVTVENAGEKLRGFFRFRARSVRVFRYRLSVFFDALLDDAVRHRKHLIHKSCKVRKFALGVLLGLHLPTMIPFPRFEGRATKNSNLSEVVDSRRFRYSAN